MCTYRHGFLQALKQKKELVEELKSTLSSKKLEAYRHEVHFFYCFFCFHVSSFSCLRVPWANSSFHHELRDFSWGVTCTCLVGWPIGNSRAQGLSSEIRLFEILAVGTMLSAWRQEAHHRQTMKIIQLKRQKLELQKNQLMQTTEKDQKLVQQMQLLEIEDGIRVRTLVVSCQHVGS